MHADIVLGQLDKNEALRYMGHRGEDIDEQLDKLITCLLYTSPSPRDCS